MLPRQMPRKRSGPRMYRRPGRRGLWCSFSDAEKHISLGTDDDAEGAEVFAAKVRERQGLLELAPGEIPLAELFSTCRERAETNHTPKTTYELHLDLRRVLAWLEARGIFSARKVSAATVEDYKTARRFDRVSAARINRELTNWKKAFKVAVEKRMAQPAALQWFARLREPRPEPHQRKVSRKELSAILRAAAKYPDHRHLFRLVLGSAIRDDEARHMEAGDVRVEGTGKKRRHWLIVTPKAAGGCECHPRGWETKGYRYRRIPISAETAKAGRAFVAARDSGCVRAGDPKSVWKVLRACCEAAGVTHYSLHSLRHGWATQMFEAGHKLGSISKWLGHADLQTTMRYLGVTDEEAPKPESLPW